MTTSLSVNYEGLEPYFTETLPTVCPRKPNFVDGWSLRTVENDDIRGDVFDYFVRHTSDDLVYIVDIAPSRPL